MRLSEFAVTLPQFFVWRLRGADSCEAQTFENSKVAPHIATGLTPFERSFLEAFDLSASLGDYVFARAGKIEFENVVVHGHTPSSRVKADQRRIGIKTKGYGSDVLTALGVTGADRRIIQCKDGAVDETPAAIPNVPAIPPRR